MVGAVVSIMMLLSSQKSIPYDCQHRVQQFLVTGRYRFIEEHFAQVVTADYSGSSSCPELVFWLGAYCLSWGSLLVLGCKAAKRNFSEILRSSRQMEKSFARVIVSSSTPFILPRISDKGTLVSTLLRRHTILPNSPSFTACIAATPRRVASIRS